MQVTAPYVKLVYLLVEIRVFKTKNLTRFLVVHRFAVHSSYEWDTYVQQMLTTHLANTQMSTQKDHDTLFIVLGNDAQLVFSFLFHLFNRPLFHIFLVFPTYLVQFIAFGPQTPFVSCQQQQEVMYSLLFNLFCFFFYIRLVQNQLVVIIIVSRIVESWHIQICWFIYDSRPYCYNLF